MGFDVGMVVTGKVTGIKKFGAFISLEAGKSGLVHISEVANSYVEDITAHLEEGQEVKVKIIGIDESGRINLSIKKAEEPTERAAPTPRAPRPPAQTNQARSGRPFSGQATPVPKGPVTFEDQLKQFMQESSSKMSGLEMYSAKKSTRRKSKG